MNFALATDEEEPHCIQIDDLRSPSDMPPFSAKDLKKIHRADFWCPRCLLQCVQYAFNAGTS